MDAAQGEPLFRADSDVFAGFEADTNIEMEDAAALPQMPRALDVTQPVAVYLGWTLIGVIGLSYALLFPVSSLLDDLARSFPRWSQVAAGGFIGIFVLTAVERAKRDRRALGYILHGALAVLAALALQDGLLADQPTQPGWYLVVAISLYGLLHLLWLEDWARGEAGPRFEQLAAGLRDLATARWWFWSSKAATALRRQNAQRQAQRVAQYEREQAERRLAEEHAAKAAAERRFNEDRLIAVRAAEEAAQSERLIATEQRRADEARHRAAEAEEKRAAAELRVLSARREMEEVQHQADSAGLNLTRHKTEQLDAERRFLDAAVAASAAAEAAAERGVEVSRARALLDRVRDELSSMETANEAQRRSS